MTFVRRLLLATALAVACAPAPVASSPTPTPISTTTATDSPTARIPVASGLATAPHAIFGPIRAWYIVPDGLSKDAVHVAVTFPDGDPSAGSPRARLRSNGRVVALAPTPGVTGTWSADVPLDGVIPGDQRIEVLVRLATGEDAVLATRDFKASAGEYVVWTLDFEGDTAGDDEMGNTAAIADSLKVPMTLMWNPRVWTTAQVTAAAADDMRAWTMARTAKGDEIGLHIHAWTDYVRASGVTPRTAPNWAGRSDGYDVPLTAFDAIELQKLIAHGIDLMREHQMPIPISFRAGGLFGNGAIARVASESGLKVDSSATPAGVFGRLPLPWTLAKDAQPYHPSPDDANSTGTLPILEVPNIAGNTFGYTSFSISTTIRDDLAMLAVPGNVAPRTRALTLVSHPATIDATERGAIETLFKAFEPFRYDRDTGPLRFVTLAQLAQAYR